VGRSGIYDPTGMIAWFPAVGLLVGGLLLVVDQLATALWSPGAAALVDVIFLAGITGALHLDGLGDAADGLYGHRSRERALEIMKDSRIGMMALVVVAACLAVKWCGIAGLDAARSRLLLLVPAYARAAMVFGIRLMPYGRPEGGTGRDLFDEPLPASAFWGVGALAALSVVCGWRMLALNLFFAVLVAGLLLYYNRKVGCITGDMLGAMTEVTEAALFFLMSMTVLQ
jgi:adenosylcobinamide-GDP ribazoletransferase